MNKIGAWLIGARGTLATTAVVGARAIVHGLASGGGLVTELPELSPLPLVGLDQLVFGGWDVGTRTILEQARALANDDRALAPGLVAALEDDLRAADLRIRDGFFVNGGPATRALQPTVRGRKRESLSAAVERLGDDLDRFRADHRLDTVVVVNVASTERTIPLDADHERLESLQRLIHLDRRTRFTPSMVYAYAALDRGYPYVNFTPSLGITAAALQQLGRKNHVPFFGCDANLLPFLMSGVSLAALLRFHSPVLTPHLVRRQRRTLMGMALLFFLLFYTFPASMVLYWTTTNAVELARQELGRRRRHRRSIEG